jgi:hypothetical protein
LRRKYEEVKEEKEEIMQVFGQERNGGKKQIKCF